MTTVYVPRYIIDDADDDITRQDIIDNAVSDDEADAAYAAMLNEVYAVSVEIGYASVQVDIAEAYADQYPVDYRCGFADWTDSEYYEVDLDDYPEGEDA